VTPDRLYRVGIVAGSKRKRRSPAAARDLYTGPQFRLAREWAEHACDTWAIVSARHGLISPSAWLNPYDTEPPPKDPARHRWARSINVSAQAMFAARRPTVFVLLCGELYREPWERGDMPYRLTHQAPMRGMGLGQQIAWLQHEIDTRVFHLEIDLGAKDRG
jgi:hypothetical protein